MPAAKVYLAPGTTDMRAGIDRLRMTFQGFLDLDPFSGHLFVFCNRTGQKFHVLDMLDGVSTFAVCHGHNADNLPSPDQGLGGLSHVAL
jgi:transposase